MPYLSLLSAAPGPLQYLSVRHLRVLGDGAVPVKHLLHGLDGGQWRDGGGRRAEADSALLCLQMMRRWSRDEPDWRGVETLQQDLILVGGLSLSERFGALLLQTGDEMRGQNFTHVFVGLGDQANKELDLLSEITLRCLEEATLKRINFANVHFHGFLRDHDSLKHFRIDLPSVGEPF